MISVKLLAVALLASVASAQEGISLLSSTQSEPITSVLEASSAASAAASSAAESVLSSVLSASSAAAASASSASQTGSAAPAASTGAAPLNDAPYAALLGAGGAAVVNLFL
ncbi:hypothetical protein BDV96DRAFT_590985 [Lophiotrema nucula]|uniref:Uncharacterized protein n=1 Tax=Lophiotrema nucula TaxID=690887 RepID=A0A6A5YHB2_9PLEO|nr:hypothetical protein BDV96DRAFT_590985 [Lophiotrema nucula]